LLSLLLVGGENTHTHTHTHTHFHTLSLTLSNKIVLQVHYINKPSFFFHRFLFTYSQTHTHSHTSEGE
jgi:hypothetical protein